MTALTVVSIRRKYRSSRLDRYNRTIFTSICWFKYGNSDSRKFNNPEAVLIKVTGLNLVQALHCPHYDSEADRKPDLKKMMKKTYGVVAIALEDCCAIEMLDDQYKIISARGNARAYKVYWRGEFFLKR